MKNRQAEKPALKCMLFALFLGTYILSAFGELKITIDNRQISYYHRDGGAPLRVNLNPKDIGFVLRVMDKNREWKEPEWSIHYVRDEAAEFICKSCDESDIFQIRIITARPSFFSNTPVQRNICELDLFHNGYYMIDYDNKRNMYCLFRIRTSSTYFHNLTK